MPYASLVLLVAAAACLELAASWPLLLHGPGVIASGRSGRRIGASADDSDPIGSATRAATQALPPSHPVLQHAPWGTAYFEGWAFRAVAADMGVAMIVIGSSSPRAQSNFTEHLVLLQYHQGDTHIIEHALLPAGAVDAWSTQPSRPYIAPLGSGRTLNFVWRVAPGHPAAGELRVHGSHVSCSFALPGLAIELGADARVAWDARREGAGVEGWASKFGTVLPCRYFVYSLASPATVRVRAPAAGGGSNARLPLAAGAEGGSTLGGTSLAAEPNGSSARRASAEPPSAAEAALAALRAPTLASSFRARVHMEGNHGSGFPLGWHWVHALGVDWPAAPGHQRAARRRAAAARRLVPDARRRQREPPQAAPNGTFLLAAGVLLNVGGVLTSQSVLAYGAPAGSTGAHGARSAALRWDFRTTDGDRLSVYRDACRGRLAVRAVSLDGTRQLRLRVEAARANFGPPLLVPTEHGFSDNPGCSEAHGARMRVSALVRPPIAGALLKALPRGSPSMLRKWLPTSGGGYKWKTVQSSTLEMGALEFGGGFSCGRPMAKTGPSPAWADDWASSAASGGA